MPHYVNFQTVLRDDSGNIVTDGFVDVQMKILDQASSTVYEETQPGVQVVRGAINIMIGEGIEPGSSPAKPTGGIPLDALDPAKGSHSLQIQFGSNQPSDPMELGSVPYAVYAEQALSLPKNFPASSVPDSFATDDEVKAAIKAHEDDTTAHPASSITVTGPLANSGSGDVQNVLKDYDTALSNKVSKTGDAMSGNLTMNANIVMQAARTVDGVDVGTLPGLITNEANTRSSADTTLQSGIDGVNTRMDKAHNPDGTIKGAGYSGIGLMVSYSIGSGTNICTSCTIDPAHPNGCLPVGFSTSDCGTSVQFIPIVQRGGENGGSGGMSVLDVYIDSSFVLHVLGDGAERSDATATILAIGTR